MLCEAPQAHDSNSSNSGGGEEQSPVSMVVVLSLCLSASRRRLKNSCTTSFSIVCHSDENDNSLTAGK